MESINHLAALPLSASCCVCPAAPPLPLAASTPRPSTPPYLGSTRRAVCVTVPMSPTFRHTPTTPTSATAAHWGVGVGLIPFAIRCPFAIRTDKPSRRVCLIIRGGVLTSLAGMGRSGTRMLGMVRKFKAASFGEASSRLAGSASAARGACGPAPRVVAPAAKEGGSGGVGGCSRRRAGGSSGGGAAGMLLAVSAMSLTGQASCFSMHAAARHGPLILRPVQHAGSTRSPLRLPGTVPRAALARATIILAPHTEFLPKIRSHLAS